MGADDSELTDELEGLIGRLLAALRIPGLNIAVARRGEVIWEHGFGYSDLSRRRAMTTESVWMSGSMGKTYTAIAILQLVESGQLRLETAVTECLRFPVMNPLGNRPITIRELLTHVSGLGESGASYSLTPPGTIEERLGRYLAGTGADFWRGGVPLRVSPVGKEFHSSNTGMALLGLVVQSVNPDKLTYGRYLQHHLIQPLGMTSTVYPDGDYLDPEVVPRRIRETHVNRIRDSRRRVDSDFEDLSAGTSQQASPSIPRDNVRVLLAMLNGGELDGARILSTAIVAMMVNPQVKRPSNSRAAPAQTVALGGMTGGAGSIAECFGHGGGHMWGWSTGYRAYPRLDLAIAVGTNQWALDAQLSGGDVSAAATLIAQLAAEIVARQADGRFQAHSSAWKISYGAGPVMALSHIWTPRNREACRRPTGRAVRGRRPQRRCERLGLGGLPSALSDVEDTDLTLEGAAAFLDSDKCALPLRREMQSGPSSAASARSPTRLASAGTPGDAGRAQVQERPSTGPHVEPRCRHPRHLSVAAGSSASHRGA